MTSQCADELRARHYLRRLGARPVGHQETPMPDRPITPSQIIPAGAPLPARAPEPGESPPWRTPPPPAPPAASIWPGPPPPPPAPVEVHHVHQVVLTWDEPESEPDPRWWERLWDRLATWRMAAAIGAALTPWVYGESPVGIWAHTVHQARTDAGVLGAYVVAGVAIGAAWALDKHSSPPGQPGRVVPRFLLVTATCGALGVLHWWDPIHALTGVVL